MNLLRKVRTMITADAPAPVAATETVDSNVITIRPGVLRAPDILDGKRSQGYLAGQLLVATPVIESGYFHKSVIYIFDHSAEGARGLVINQPAEVAHLGALLHNDTLSQEDAEREIPVYFGGPVERIRGFVLHSSDYVRDFTLAVGGEIAVTASSLILEDILAGRGPRNAALVVGYAGWGAGQLEQEIAQNGWITVPASASLVFGTDNALKWAMASESLGIDMAFYSTAVGHA